MTIAEKPVADMFCTSHYKQLCLLPVTHAPASHKQQVMENKELVLGRRKLRASPGNQLAALKFKVQLLTLLAKCAT